MGVTINGIYCDEIVEGFQEAIDFQHGPTARKGYICNWTERFQVANGLLGFNHAATIAGFITINLPMQYPEIPYMYVHDIQFEGRGQPFQGPYGTAWPKVIVWANFACMEWSFSAADDPGARNQLGNFLYAEQQLNASAQMLEIEGKWTVWNATGKPTNQHYMVRLPLVEMIITFQRVPYLPSNAVLGLVGSLNDRAFLGVSGLGKVMFNGCQSQRTRNPDGSVATQLTYQFTARSQPWDYGFNPATNAWDLVIGASGAFPFMPRVDLSVVLPNPYLVT